MIKRSIGILLCVFITVAAITGCDMDVGVNSFQNDSGAKEDPGNGNEADNDASAKEDDTVTISYWGWDVNNFATPLMDRYHELHPEVNFETLQVEWGDMLPKTAQAYQSGAKLPTIIPMDLGFIGAWKNMEEIFTDLRDYGLDSTNYNEALMSASTDDKGKIFGLVEAVDPAGIAYKRDLAKKYLGTDDPEKIQEMLKSYEDYIRVGKEISEKSGGKAVMFHSGQAVAEWFYFASTIPNEEGGAINATDKYTDILEKLISFRDAGIVDSLENGSPEGNEAYADDIHVFFPCPDWAVSYYLESNDPEGTSRGNWGLIMAPEGYQHGGTAMGITESSSEAEKKAAYDFITWVISTEEGASVMKDTAGYITHDKRINKGDFAKRSDENVFGGEDISKIFYNDISERIRIASPSAFDGDITNVRDDVSQLVMENSSVGLEEAVEAAREELKSIINDNSVEIK